MRDFLYNLIEHYFSDNNVIVFHKFKDKEYLIFQFQLTH